MKFFVDTADVKEIKELYHLGLVDGVTTNPSLILKSGGSISEVTKQICNIVEGPVSAEVVATDFPDDEGSQGAGEDRQERLHQGAADAGRVEGMPGDPQRPRPHGQRHACFSANQALLAAKAGASFISPFVGRIDDTGSDGMELISEIRQIYDNYDYKTEILTASIRSVNHVKQAALIGPDVITAPPATLRALVSHPLTDKGLAAFLADWAKTGQKIG